MTFKPQTINYTSDIGIFHMLPGNPFGSSLYRDFIANQGLPTDRGVGAAFIIIEGYTYEFTPDNDSDIAQYFKHRSGSVADRFNLFCLAVDIDRIDIIFDAFSASRNNPHKDVPKDEEAIEAKKNGSKSPSKTPSTANAAKES